MVPISTFHFTLKKDFKKRVLLKEIIIGKKMATAMQLSKYSQPTSELIG